MLGKLFKYDFKWINRAMPVYYILLVLISISIKIIEYILNTKTSILFVIADKALVSMFIGCSVSTMITCLVRIWVRYINNLYKDESYLTHTLPVTKNEIFNSKIISSVCSILMSTLAVVASVALVYLNSDNIELLKIRWESLVNAYNTTFSVLFIVGMVLVVLLEVIYIMMSGIMGITLGHKSNNHKMIKSIIFGISGYGILSVISLIIVFIISEFVDTEISGNGFPSMQYMYTIGISSIIIYLVFNMIYYLISKKVLNKGVNVE